MYQECKCSNQKNSDQFFFMIEEPIKELEKTDKILFNSRKTPLTVQKAEQDKILVEGPKGGQYQIYRGNNSLLVSDADSRKYSSYCKELRKVGTWEKENSRKYIHTKTKAYLKLEQNNTEYWHIKTDLNTSKYDLPKYGFNDKEVAEEQLEKIKRDNPEG